MTDDELERALFALPLEEPPVGLHARILAATVSPPRLTFHTWEIWLIGALVALMVCLAFIVGTSSADIGGAVGALMWTVLGISFVVWISQLSLPVSRRKAANH